MNRRHALTTRFSGPVMLDRSRDAPTPCSLSGVSLVLLGRLVEMIPGQYLLARVGNVRDL